MTTDALNDTATVRDVLFGGAPVEPTDALAESLREHGTSRTLVTGFPGLTAVVEREVAAAANGLLSLNLLDLTVAGWKQYLALTEAARRTRDDPTAEEVVAFATHQIKSSHPSTIELFIDGKSVGTIQVALDVAFDMAGVLAVVCEARLTAIRSGNCTVTGTLAIEQTVVAQRSRKFDLPGAIRLRHGVALLEPAATATRVKQAVGGTGESPSPSAAWHPDPTRRSDLRWWDGTRWTDHVAAQGRVMSDPVVCEPVSAP